MAQENFSTEVLLEDYMIAKADARTRGEDPPCFREFKKEYNKPLINQTNGNKNKHLHKNS